MSLTAPWSPSATKMLPADSGCASLVFRTETCALRSVVAPHECSKTTARLSAPGEGDSEITLFSHGRKHATSQTDKATTGIAVLRCDTAHLSRVMDVRCRY